MPELSDEQLREIYRTAQTIAVVGASTDPDKAAHRIPAYLGRQGYEIIPVNPTSDEVLDTDAYDSLAEVEHDIDVVDVFRPAEECPDIAQAAVDIGARVLWLQEGIVSEAAERIASDAGLTVVMDRCMGSTHRRLMT